MALDLSPRFTVSMRGYDKEEVENYLETVSERSTQADDQLYELQEQNRFLEDEHALLTARVEELEVAIRSETPHTVGALGERITLILNEAEAGAADTLSDARARAERLVTDAQREADRLHQQASAAAAKAAETLIAAEREATEIAERLETEGAARAAGILSDAEMRAQRRQEQIEAWAQEAIASTHAEQARLADEFATVRRHHDAEVRALLGDRDDAVAAMRSLQTSLARAIERVPTGNAPLSGVESPAGDRAGSTVAKTVEVPAGAAGAAPSHSTTGAATPGATLDDDDHPAGTTVEAAGEESGPEAAPATGATSILYDAEEESPTSMIDITDWSADS